MARPTLLLIALLSVAFVLVSGGNNMNSSTTPATPKAPSVKPPISVPGTGIVTKIIEAAEEIPKAVMTTCVDTLEAFGSLFSNPFG